MQLAGRAHGDQLAVTHHRDAVGQQDRLLHVVGDHHRGQAEPLVQRAVGPSEAIASDRVQSPEGLVHQDDPGPRGQGAGDPDPLPLTAGKRGRRARPVAARQADQIEQLQRPGLGVGAAPAEQGGGDGDVLGDAQVREEADALEHVADAAAQLGRRQVGRRPPLDQHPAAIGLDQAVDHLQGSGLA